MNAPRAGDRGAATGARALFWLVLLIGAYWIPRGVQANADSHLALTYAIVEQHTVRIDRFAPGLLDKAVYCGHNTNTHTCRHYYSDKAPGLSLWVAAVYTVLRPVLPPALMPADPQADRFLLRWLLTLLAITVPCAAFAATYWRFLTRFADAGSSLLVTAGYAFGSMVLPFSMLLFSHALSAALLFWAFMALYRVRRHETPTWFTVAAGALAGYAIGCEYPTAIIAALLGAYILLGSGAARDRVEHAGLYVVGVACGLLPAIAYNLAAFGTPLAGGYTHLTDPYYAQGMARGLLGIGLPTWDAVWGTSFSPYRGLFVLSPWLLLAIPGLRAMARRGLLAECLLCAAVSVAYFIFQAGYVFWDGGASVGPRHFLPALPFLAFPVVFALQRSILYRSARLLIAISIVVLGLVVITNPLFGDPHFVAGVRNPLIDQTLHDLAIGRLQNNWGMVLHLPGYSSLLPLALLVWVMSRRLRRGVQASVPDP